MNDKEKAFWVKESDMVEVVRCKDCCSYTKSGWCNLLMMNIHGEFYCAGGNRRKHGQE
jgi:hypothetical protein